MSDRVNMARLAAEVVADVMRVTAWGAAIRPAALVLHESEVRCVKCQRPTRRRLDQDVGIHEECER